MSNRCQKGAVVLWLGLKVYYYVYSSSNFTLAQLQQPFLLSDLKCRNMYGMDAVFVHDAAALAAVVRPDFFGWKKGKVIVVADGPAKGKTVMDECKILNRICDKRWNKSIIFVVLYYFALNS